MKKMNIDCYPNDEGLGLSILTSSRNSIGENYSVKEEFLLDKYNLTSKVECVIKCVEKGHFSFQEALVVYSLTLDEFRSLFNEKY